MPVAQSKPVVIVQKHFTSSKMEFNHESDQYDLCLDGKFVNVSLEAPELHKVGVKPYNVLRINPKGYGSLLACEEGGDIPLEQEAIQDIIDSIPVQEEVDKTIQQLGLSPKKAKQLSGLRKVTVSSLINIRDNLETSNLDSIKKHIEVCSFLKITDEKFIDLTSQLHHVIREYGKCSQKESNLTIPEDSAYHMNKLALLGIAD